MAEAALQAGFRVTFGDLIYSLGIPIPLHSPRSIRLMAALLLPVLSRLPFEWLYPTGEKQDEHKPKFNKWYEWATVVAGDCHYIKRHMPLNMQGKVIVTNTTTPEDVEFFRKAGVKYLVTTTPVLEG
ncbi:MAG: quinate 5-dehydrogenase, partial [Candidatus Bathyarchaeia archaeon]